MPQTGEISRDGFIQHVTTCNRRHCRLHITDADGEPFIDAVKAEITAFDANSTELLFSVGESEYGLRLISADRFKYLDIDEQMREEGYLEMAGHIFRRQAVGQIAAISRLGLLPFFGH